MSAQRWGRLSVSNRFMKGYTKGRRIKTVAKRVAGTLRVPSVGTRRECETRQLLIYWS